MQNMQISTDWLTQENDKNYTSKLGDKNNAERDIQISEISFKTISTVPACNQTYQFTKSEKKL
jgi:hypothetical protein